MLVYTNIPCYYALSKTKKLSHAGQACQRQRRSPTCAVQQQIADAGVECHADDPLKYAGHGHHAWPLAPARASLLPTPCAPLLLSPLRSSQLSAALSSPYWRRAASPQLRGMPDAVAEARAAPMFCQPALVSSHAAGEPGEGL